MYRRRNSEDDLHEKGKSTTKKSLKIEFHNITYCISSKKKKDNKFLLHNVSGEINSGELTAIIGPSGAGKTTLMNILSGHKPFGSHWGTSVTGSILVNGEYRDTLKFREIASYVGQDCAFFAHFSVKETMMFAINCKLPEKLPHESKKQKVNEILHTLKLIGSEDTKVLNLSGGERKRLSIAVELITSPPIMFLDEPTSGLDSLSCNTYISLLKSLANESRAIVCSIHQPSSKIFEKFDKLIVLTNGQCVYRGHANDLIPFLSSLDFHCPEYYNPADFVLEKITGKRGAQISLLVEKVNKSLKEDTNSKENNTDPVYMLKVQSNDKTWITTFQNIFAKDNYQTSKWTQFRLLFSRDFISTIRDIRLLVAQFFSRIFLGLLLGFMLFDIGNNAEKFINNASLLFLGNLFLLMCSQQTMLLLIPLEKKIISREHLNGWYGVFPYFIAKNLSQAIFEIIYVVVFTSIVYWMTSQPNELFRFIYFLLFEISAVLASITSGLGIGALTNSQGAILVGCAFAMHMMLFCGFFIRINAIPYYLRGAHYTSYIYYSYEGIATTVYGFNRSDLECNGICLLTSPSAILEELNLQSSHFHLDFLGLYISTIIFLCATYIILRWKLK